MPPTADLLPLAPSVAEPDDDDDLEDDDLEDDDMDVYDDEDDEVPHPSSAPPPDDPNSSPSSSTDDDDGLRSAAPNGLPPLPQPQQPPPPTTAILSLAADPSPSSSRQQQEERRSFSSIEERRLFQRLWTDEDEIAILQGFYEFTSRRGTTHHAHQHDTGPFYEEIRNRLQLDFTKNQLVEKIRRLKKKYRNVVTRMSSGRDFAFKSPHERATYEIARKIWSASVSRKGLDNDDDDDLNDAPEPFESKDHSRARRGVKRPASAVVATEAFPVEVKSVAAIPISVTPPPPPPPVSAPTPVPPPQQSLGGQSLVEETVRNCFSPLVKDLVQYAVSGALGNGSMMGLGMVPLGFAGNSSVVASSLGSKDVLDGRWRKQQILELEVYAKRLELVQELIKVKLEELRSLG